MLDLAVTNRPDFFAAMTVGERAIALSSDHLPVRVTATAPLARPRNLPAAVHSRWRCENAAAWAGYRAAAEVHGAEARDECERLAHSLDRASDAPARGGVAAVAVGGGGVPVSEEALEVVEAMNAAVTGACVASADGTVGWKACSRRKKRWWSHSREVRSAYAAFHAAQQRLVRAGLRGDDEAKATARERRREARNDFRRFAKLASAASWRELADACESPEHGRLVWSAFRRLHGRPRETPTAIAFKPPAPGQAIAPRAPAPLGVAIAAPPLPPPSPFAVAAAAADAARPASEPERALNTLARHLASVCTLAPDPRDALLLDACGNGDAIAEGVEQSDRLTALCNAPVTEAEVAEAFAHARLNGANGPDALPAHFLRHAPAPLIAAFTSLYNVSLRYGVLPAIWRSANVAPVYKGKGADPTDATAWRPISLTSVVVKVLERLLLARLVAVAGPRMHSAQHGFRAGYSCEAHVLGLRADIEHRTRERHQRLPVAFVDVAHAFDGLWHAAILHQLWRLGVRGALWRWLRAWLTGRRMRVVYDGKASRWYFTTAGSPQGGVVSPFMSNSFFDYFCTLPGPLALCVLRLFADDIALYARALRRRASHSLAREHAALRLVLAAALRQLSDAFTDRRCRANVSKSGVVTFVRSCPGRRARAPRDADDGKRGGASTVDEVIARAGAQWVPRMHGAVVPAVEQYVYLGVTLHQSLRWDAHLARTLTRVRAAAHRITRVLSATGGPRVPTVRHLVVALLLPVIAYGGHVWSPFACRRRDALQNAYATPLRIALGLPRSAHLASVLAECGVPDLRALFDRALLSFVARAVAGPNAELRDAMIPLVRERPPLLARMPAVLADFAAAQVRVFGEAAALAAGAVAVAYATDAASMGRAVLRSSLRRWAERPVAGRECSELVPRRTGGHAVPVGGARVAVVGDGVDAGMAEYIAVLPRVAVRMVARLRLNRSYVADSLHRRGMLASPLCARCAPAPPPLPPPPPPRAGDDAKRRARSPSPPAPLRVGRQLRGVNRARSPPRARDTVEHFLLHCPGEAPAHALDAARVRFCDLFAPLAGLPRAAAARALLGGPLPREHAEYALRPVGFSHLPRLAAFYGWLVAHDLAQ